MHTGDTHDLCTQINAQFANRKASRKQKHPKRRNLKPYSNWTSVIVLSLCHLFPTPTMSLTKEERVEEINDKIRAQLFRKGTSGLSGVARVFKQADFNGNKKLDEDEFEEALSFAGVFLSASELHTLFSVYDRNGDGNIGYEEFIKGLAPDLSGPRLDTVKRAFRKIDADGALCCLCAPLSCIDQCDELE